MLIFKLCPLLVLLPISVSLLGTFRKKTYIIAYIFSIYITIWYLILQFNILHICVPHFLRFYWCYTRSFPVQTRILIWNTERYRCPFDLIPYPLFPSSFVFYKKKNHNVPHLNVLMLYSRHWQASSWDWWGWMTPDRDWPVCDS